MPQAERECMRVALLVDRESSLASPFLARVIAGIEDVLAEERMTLSIPRMAADGRVLSDDCRGALVLPGTFDADTLTRVAALDMPCVRIAETEIPMPGCSLDLANAAEALCAGLLKRGARRIAALSGHGGFLDREKLRGIQSALTASHATCQLAWRETMYDAARVPDALASLQKECAFDTVIAFDDTLALAAMQWLRAEKIQVPEAVRVAGFNNMPFAAFAQPPLTSVSVPIEDAAGEATRMLVRMIRGKAARRARHFPCSIEWRASTDDA